ncbi:hypothetical protein [Desulfobacter curvatus]|uniref:GltB/FmdC/FwdC-like GXGXG domain-containing protein n=1 Tax=Desulfobacter curvatus TaxID=2290 RepID=UPI00037C30E5|nr:hypothetical protein [Desulfobacter curvatus]
MVNINSRNLSSKELNNIIKKKLGVNADIVIEHPASMHNLGTALIGKGSITVKGSTGFYTGGFLEGPSLIIEGNTGWYTGDNMCSGEIIIKQNAGSNAGPSMIGGNLVIYGSTGSRAGVGLKGGNLIICGDCGRWTGQMTLGGRIVVLGKIGLGFGESMYRGLLHTRDPEAESKLGGNVEFHKISHEEAESLAALLEQYEIDADAAKFKSVRPMTSGRHTYTLFKPTHKKSLES